MLDRETNSAEVSGQATPECAVLNVNKSAHITNAWAPVTMTTHQYVDILKKDTRDQAPARWPDVWRTGMNESDNGRLV